MTAAWPFGTDADRDDPLTALRIAVTGSHPMWCYLVGFDRKSMARPTEREAAMLASYLEDYKTHWYGPDDGSGYRFKMARRLLDVDGRANGVTFHKYGENDWGYRRRTWSVGPRFLPPSPAYRERYPDEARGGPMTLEQVMDLAHETWPKRWLDWKAARPEVFGPCTRCEGSGVDPEHTAPENYGDAVRELETPCAHCQLVAG